MKTLFYILAFNICAISFAQDPQLFENTWYLYSVQGTDLDPVYTVSEIDPPIYPFLIINENLEFNGEGACNSFTGVYEVLSTDELGAIDFTETGQDCGVQLHNSFEFSYFGFIEGGFSYSITQDGTGSVLTMETPLFGHAVFKSYPPLSVTDFNSEKLTIYPNPVEKELFINLNHDAGDVKIKLFDFHGKLIMSKDDFNVNYNSINVQALTSGIYIIRLEDTRGNTAMKKIIKH
ncbi:MAG: T9SS type A sorting domain-containing protein [Flavobacteriales bacterium]|jgi:heat shock protein HslJ|nr:T9SS type A sorting domain-containing protein [Flavobacteriales bacterium]